MHVTLPHHEPEEFPLNRTGFLRRTTGHTALVLSALTMVCTLGVGAADATPIGRPPTTTCNPATEPVWIEVTASQVDPVVTDFLAVNVANGTTGQRTESLTQVDSVTTTVNRSTEITANFALLFVKVQAKVGFSVQSTTSSTTTSQITSTWNFNNPGYYGLYRGTRRVQGSWVKYLCAETGPNTGVWINALKEGVGTFTTYETPEIGTVVCTVPEPAATLRRVAQMRLGC
ncbi:hypothetical protein ACFVFS_23855 [Kitasatospora sp. NPDC057692]|uniref:hypothetical protein n=1 Tax=Kitasatospora sp. NPDC057692 TaxID=3346215 RepID=UPI00369F5BE2